MKRLLPLVVLLLCVFQSNAQILSYTDQAVLFSQDENYGTARFVGMSGAFGALGNDMTAADINPAGLGVYKQGEFAATLGYRNTDINTTFYGNTIPNSDDYFRLTQIGGMMAWDTYGNPDFYRFAWGFNYNVTNHFNNNWISNGNSGVPEFLEDPFLNYDDDPNNDVFYTEVEDQTFQNYVSGINDRFVFSFATLYKEIFYMGVSLAFHHLNFYQQTIYEEINNDGAFDVLDAYNSQTLSTYGSGFNFGIGGILTPTKGVRLGLSYQSPVWFNLSERSHEYLDIVLTNTEEVYVENYDPNYFDYKLKTPSKLTGSFAYVFGQSGLISFDYIWQNYSNTKLQPSSAFIDENAEMSQGLRNTNSFKIGTEWKYNIFSFRGGYRMIQSPYKNFGSEFDTTGYSLGLGLRFSRKVALDFAYDSSTLQDQYRFLHIDGVQPAELDIRNDRFTSSLVINFN